MSKPDRPTIYGYSSSGRLVGELRQPAAAPPASESAARFRMEPTTTIRDGDYISVPRQALAKLLHHIDPGGFQSPDLEVNWDRDGRLVEREHHVIPPEADS